MRKTLLSLALGAAVLATAGSASAKVTYTITPLSDEAYQMRKALSINKADIVVDENFESFLSGDEENPDWDHRLCSHYDSELIAPSLTHGAQWKGHNVCMAGGRAALKNINPMDPAYLNTPMRDYSGTVTVTFLIKAIPTTWQEEDANGEIHNMYFSNTTVMTSLRTDDFNTEFDFGPDTELEDGVNFFSLPFYPEHGWQEVKIEFDNYSAYNDAYFEIACTGNLLVDDMRITQSVDKFIGSPVFQGITAATDDSFTISFTPVNHAYNYYCYLYELDGYDEDGNPNYKTVVLLENLFTEEDIKQIEAMGMTLEEYLLTMAEQMGVSYEELMDMLVYDKPYNHLGQVREDGSKLYTFTYNHLDPTKQYYFDIRSHYYHTFSTENIQPANFIGSPENLAATDIKEDSFTANWGKISQAEGYTVDLYGVNECVVIPRKMLPL